MSQMQTSRLSSYGKDMCALGTHKSHETFQVTWAQMKKNNCDASMKAHARDYINDRLE